MSLRAFVELPQKKLIALLLTVNIRCSASVQLINWQVKFFDEILEIVAF